MTRIAFAPLARLTFDIPFATEVTQTAQNCLQAAGFELLCPQGLINDLQAAESFAAQLALEPPDLLIIFQATFADSTMLVQLAQAVDAPIFLWAVPEPRSGGRLRLNSLCGINLAGHALTLRGKKYDYAYASPDDPGVLAQVRSLAAAGMVRRRLKSARLGVVAEHPNGMDSCHLDSVLLQEKLGVQVAPITLGEVFHRARTVPEAEVVAVRQVLDQRLDNLDHLDQKPLSGTLSVYQALRGLAGDKALDGMAVRCWPEFFTDLGCSACGAMSMLSDGLGQHAPLPCSCEADANGTITQMILYWLAGEPAFGTDIVSVDFDEDVIALWHCGLAPLSMANPAYQPHGGIHSNRKVPLVMDFPLKPGVVTVARLSQATGTLRLVLGRGEMLDAPAPFAGTAGLLRLEKPARHFFDVLLGEGLEHHISMVYGDHVAALEALAQLLELPVLSL